MSITKNRQSPETLRRLAEASFPGRAVRTFSELTEGLFNAAYRVDFEDGGASILKIAAAGTEGLLSNEINMMAAEVAAMELAHRHGLPFVAHVQHSDFSRTICSGAFFFMEVLPGRSLNSCKDELSAQAQEQILEQVGQFQRQTAAIRGTHFGLMGDERRFDSLYDLVRYMFRHVLNDAQARSVDLRLTPDDILARLEQDRAVFDEAAEPSFVHWDMWEGNIFVENGGLSGVIDWERALWGDPYMDDRFRRHTRHPAFLRGYGQAAFTPSEVRRIAWYDVFLYVTMITECTYRQYDIGLDSWLRPLLAASWAEICRA
ncbi:MAG: aminoglycoside phosphotransferase family protein [Clostridia bacterium]|nr:aminoglycoside phosphotransferase family protein [Clostridia bacterium]